MGTCRRSLLTIRSPTASCRWSHETALRTGATAAPHPPARLSLKAHGAPTHTPQANQAPWQAPRGAPRRCRPPYEELPTDRLPAARRCPVQVPWRVGAGCAALRRDELDRRHRGQARSRLCDHSIMRVITCAACVCMCMCMHVRSRGWIELVSPAVADPEPGTVAGPRLPQHEWSAVKSCVAVLAPTDALGVMVRMTDLALALAVAVIIALTFALALHPHPRPTPTPSSTPSSLALSRRAWRIPRAASCERRAHRAAWRSRSCSCCAHCASCSARRWRWRRDGAPRRAQPGSAGA